MAFAAGLNIGTALSTTANQASLVMTTSQSAAANVLVVLLVAVDNNQATTGASTAVSSVTSSVANTWTRAIEFANAGGATQAGADISIWYSRLTNTISTGGTITATFTTATLADAAAMTAFSFTTPNVVEVAATNTLANTAAVMGSLDATTTNIQCLRVRAVASESSGVVTLTATSGWTRFTQAISGTGTSDTEIGVRGEWIISTGTGAASAPTNGAGVADHASAYVAFKEQGVAPASPNKDNFFLVM